MDKLPDLSGISFFGSDFILARYMQFAFIITYSVSRDSMLGWICGTFLYAFNYHLFHILSDRLELLLRTSVLGEEVCSMETS